MYGGGVLVVCAEDNFVAFLPRVKKQIPRPVGHLEEDWDCAAGRACGVSGFVVGEAVGPRFGESRLEEIIPTDDFLCGYGGV